MSLVRSLFALTSLLAATTVASDPGCVTKDFGDTSGGNPIVAATTLLDPPGGSVHIPTEDCPRDTITKGVRVKACDVERDGPTPEIEADNGFEKVLVLCPDCDEGIEVSTTVFCGAFIGESVM